MKQYLEDRIAELTTQWENMKIETDGDEMEYLSDKIHELELVLEHYNQQQQLSSDAEEVQKQLKKDIVDSLYITNGSPNGTTAIMRIVNKYLQNIVKPVPVTTDVEVLAEQMFPNVNSDKEDYEFTINNALYQQYLQNAFIAGYQARVIQEGRILSEEEIDQMVDEYMDDVDQDYVKMYPVDNVENSYKKGLIDMQNKLRKL